MRRAAPVLISALFLGAGAGFFVHSGMAGETKPEAAPVSHAPMRQVPPLIAQSAVPPAVPQTPEVRTAAPSLWIPRLDLKTRIFAPSQLDRGPAWWPITGRPGGGDTIAVAGHRTTNTRPFYFLERLRAGDRIHVTSGGEKRVYRVSETRVVSASNLHIGDAVGYERLLLTACTPRGSAEFRLVVEALPA